MSSDAQAFSRLDIAFAQFLSQRATLQASQKQAFERIVMTLSQQQSQGHSCIALDDEASALVLASGLAGHDVSIDCLPLVLEQNRLYLQRYWRYEERLARQITAMSQASFKTASLDELLDSYFSCGDGIDWQREAARMAVIKPFSIITGGPGTGKTTTVIKILALLQELAVAGANGIAGHPLHIALVAPTGKAAMRLQESIGDNKARLPCSEILKSYIPEAVTTLHRLLGARPPSPYFRHHAGNPLVHDVVVMDETSMVDLALMSKLLDALRPGAKLILLGDKDQLASIESGSVLADLTEALPKQTIELKKSHRFAGAIKTLADAVNGQQAEMAWELLSKGEGGIALLEQDLIDYVVSQQRDYLQLIKHGVGFDEIYRVFSRFQVLCANRQGKHSVADINHRVEQKLSGLGLINLSATWYPGRPVMVTQNDTAVHLYNGDIGICLPDTEQNGECRVFFQRADGSVKKYLPARMPGCETVFAMTIHKSQGSEFEEVLIVLPDISNAVLTKELLYTAISRAKKTVKLVAEKEVFAATVSQKVQRVSGLVEKFTS